MGSGMTGLVALSFMLALLVKPAGAEDITVDLELRRLIGANEFQATRSVMDISGDGPNNYGTPAPVARDAVTDQELSVSQRASM